MVYTPVNSARKRIPQSGWIPRKYFNAVAPRARTMTNVTHALLNRVYPVNRIRVRAL
jgi:hypothetical protein